MGWDILVTLDNGACIMVSGQPSTYQPLEEYFSLVVNCQSKSNFEWMQTTASAQLNVQSGNPNQWKHGLGKGFLNLMETIDAAADAGPILVHCNGGVHRSPALAAGGQMTVADAKIAFGTVNAFDAFLEQPVQTALIGALNFCNQTLRSWRLLPLHKMQIWRCPYILANETC